VAPYDLQFHGRADLFPGLAGCRTEDEVRRFPLVELEALAGQPTMIGDDAPSYAVAGSLAAAKALVLAGFGVGALLSYMLAPPDRALLVRARTPHDPDCALWVVPSAGWAGEVESGIARVIADGLAAAVRDATAAEGPAAEPAAAGGAAQ
jgi:DNA-binding transcriptional LysR family regulator